MLNCSCKALNGPKAAKPHRTEEIAGLLHSLKDLALGKIDLNDNANQGAGSLCNQVLILA